MPFNTKADEVVSYLSLAIDGQALGAAAYTAAKDDLAVRGENAYATAAASNLASMSTAAVAAQVLTNLGVTAATIGQASYDALLPAFITQLDLYGAGSRGQVILNVTRLLAPLTADATYGAAARAWVATGDKAQAYSVNAANTGPATISALNPASLSLTLTTAAETLSGGSGNDTFTSSFLTANGGDSLDGGAGTDTLNIETSSDIVKTFATKSIEVINVTNYGDRTFNADAVKGATSINSVNATGNLTIAGLTENVGVGLTSSVARTVTANYTADALKGTADKLTVTLNGATATSGNGVVVNAGFESVEIVARGASTNTLDTLTAPGVTAGTISGDGKFTAGSTALAGLTALTVTNTADVSVGTISALKTLTATGGGKFSGTLGTDADSSTFTITGAGNDTITVNDNTDASTDSIVVSTAGGDDSVSIRKAASGGSLIISTGDGNDTLTILSTSSANAGSADVLDLGAGDNDTLSIQAAGNGSFNLKGVEKVSLGASATGTQTFNADKAFALTSSSATTNVQSLPAGATVTASAATTTTLNIGFAATEASLTVPVKAVSGAVTFARVTTGQIDATDTFNATSISNAAMSTLTINGLTALKSVTVPSMSTSTTKLTVTGQDAVTVADQTSAMATLTVTGAKAVSVGTSTASGAGTKAVSATSTGLSVSVANIGTNAAAITSVDVSGATTASVGTIRGASIGDVRVTATNGLLTAGAVTAANSTGTSGTIGTVTLTSTAGGIKTGNISAIAPAGYTASLTAKTFIDANGDGTGAASTYSNTKGSVTVNLTGDAAAKLDVSASDSSTTANANGVVTLNASGLKGGLTATVTNESLTGTSTITLGAASSSTVNTVTIRGSAKAAVVNGSIGRDTIVDADIGVAPGGIDGADANAVNSSDTFTGGDGIDTISYAGHAHTAVTGLVGTGSTNGMAINLSGSDKTFDASSLYPTTVRAGTAAQYNSSGDGSTTTLRTIVAGGEVDTLSGFEAVIGSSQNDYIIVANTGMSVTGGAGVDIIELGAGSDTVIMGAGDGTAGNITSGSSGNMTNIDKVVGFSTSDYLSVFGLSSSATFNTTLNGANNNTVNGGPVVVSIVRGDYSPSTKTFTVNASGASTLVQYDSDPGAGFTIESVLLIGFADGRLIVTGSGGIGI